MHMKGTDIALVKDDLVLHDLVDAEIVCGRAQLCRGQVVEQVAFDQHGADFFEQGGMGGHDASRGNGDVRRKLHRIIWRINFIAAIRE